MVKMRMADSNRLGASEIAGTYPATSGGVEREGLRLLSCLAGVSLLVTTLIAIILYQHEVLEWASRNMFLRGPAVLFGVLVDTTIIVALVLNGGCARDLHCPHAYRGRWHRQNKH